MERFLIFTSSVKGHIAKGTSKGAPPLCKTIHRIILQIHPPAECPPVQEFRALHSATKDRKPFEKGLTENFCGQLPLDLT